MKEIDKLEIEFKTITLVGLWMMCHGLIHEIDMIYDEGERLALAGIMARLIVAIVYGIFEILRRRKSH